MELMLAEPRPVSPLGDPPISILDALLERNEIRTQLILNNPFFLLWREGKLDDEQARRTMLDCLTLLADTFETFSSSRLERDHDDVRGSHEALVSRDPILRATAVWYRQQVQTLDEASKTVLGLALETVGYYLGVLARSVLAGQNASNDFDTPAERQARQREIYRRLPLLERPHAFVHLHTVLEQTWDVLDEATTRIATLLSPDTR